MALVHALHGGASRKGTEGGEAVAVPQETSDSPHTLLTDSGRHGSTGLAMAMLVGGASQSVHGDDSDAVRLASIAVRVDPSALGTWAQLSAALYARSVRTGRLADMDGSTAAADTCIELANAPMVAPSVLQESAHRVRSAVIVHWAEIQSCWTRVSAALLNPSSSQTTLQAAAAICRACAQKYERDPARRGHFVVIYGVCEVLCRKRDGFDTLATGLRLLSEASRGYWRMAGELLEYSGRADAAAQCYSASGASEAGALLRRSLCHTNCGDSETAVDEASQGVRLGDDSSMAACLVTLGLAKKEAGDLKGAKKVFSKAEASVPHASSLFDR